VLSREAALESVFLEYNNPKKIAGISISINKPRLTKPPFKMIFK
jgi:hypothetical protein